MPESDSLPPQQPPTQTPPKTGKSLEEFFAIKNSGRRRKGDFRPQTPGNVAFSLGLKRRRFWEMVQRPEWHCLTTKDKAKVLDVSTQTIHNWENALSHEEWKKALEISRERHAKTSLKIDASVVKESLKGNVKAAELFYRRIEGWAPKSGMELTRGPDGDLSSKGDRELLVGLLASLPLEERKALLADAEAAQVQVPQEPGQSLMEMKTSEVQESDHIADVSKMIEENEQKQPE